MTNTIDRRSDNVVRAQARTSGRGQSPGFQRIRIGELLITALYDGFVPVPADELHGAPSVAIRSLLTEAYLSPQGDPRTAVIAFLMEQNGSRILIDAGSGDSLGPDTGYLAANLCAAGIDADGVDHVLLTHLHPDHAGGLIADDGTAAFSQATVHAARADADYWLDAAGAAGATGVQRLVYETAERVLAPYRDSGRFVTFDHAKEPIPGVVAADLAGHSPGHTGYLFGSAGETVLFWGDTVHSHAVQLRRPSVSTAADSDEAAAVASRRNVFDVVATNRWWVGGAHLPFPGLGHLRQDRDRYTWVPVNFTPLE